MLQVFATLGDNSGPATLWEGCLRRMGGKFVQVEPGEFPFQRGDGVLFVPEAFHGAAPGAEVPLILGRGIRRSDDAIVVVLEDGGREIHVPLSEIAAIARLELDDEPSLYGTRLPALS